MNAKPHVVKVPDCLENTGLDSAVFPSQRQARQAWSVLRTCRDLPGNINDFGPSPSKEKPNTTFAEWNAAGW